MRPFGRCTRNAEHFLHEHGLKTAPSVINAIVLRRKSSSSGDRAAASNLTADRMAVFASGSSFDTFAAAFDSSRLEKFPTQV